MLGLTGIKRFLLLVFAILPVVACADKMVFETPPKQINTVSGEGNVVRQNRDGSVDTYREGADSKNTDNKGDDKWIKRHPIKQPRCTDWNGQRKSHSLLIENNALLGTTEESFLTSVYINGAMDALNKKLDDNILGQLDKACEKEDKRSITDLLGSLK